MTTTKEDELQLRTGWDSEMTGISFWNQGKLGTRANVLDNFVARLKNTGKIIIYGAVR